MPTKEQDEKEHLCPASRNKRSIAEAGRKRIDIRNCCSIVASVFLLEGFGIAGLC